MKPDITPFDITAEKARTLKNCVVFAGISKFLSKSRSYEEEFVVKYRSYYSVVIETSMDLSLFFAELKSLGYVLTRNPDGSTLVSWEPQER
jgi:hypothetical protein